MVHLIQGFFFQNFQSLGIAFGPDGSMTVVRGGLYRFMFAGAIFSETIHSTILVGEMNDCFGESHLFNVVITKDELTFEKKYEHRRDYINYKFQREGNIWVGGYEGLAVGIGGAKCITTEVPAIFFQPPEKS